MPTSYALDANTPVQAVEQRDASYPAIADPSWWETAAAWAGTAATAAAVGVCLATVCSPVSIVIAAAAAGSAVAFVAGQMIPDSSNPGGGSRPSNTCHMRNHRGC